VQTVPAARAAIAPAIRKGLHLSTQEIRIRHVHHTLMQYVGKTEV
jgi:hypothetical protein